MSAEALTLAATQEKAFRINMDKRIYGTFAEIGAGQETANWFFRSSGAAGTVAKTISAYDMTVSDTLYGPVRRYVSQEMNDFSHDTDYMIPVPQANLYRLPWCCIRLQAYDPAKTKFPSHRTFGRSYTSLSFLLRSIHEASEYPQF